MTHHGSASLATGRRMPFVFERSVAPPGDDPTRIKRFVEQNLDQITARLVEHGAILFRDLGIDQAEAFGAFVDALGVENLDYVYRSTPRTSKGRGVYTATEYPSAREIPMHNENSYQRIWPRKLAFCCAKAALSGGATPLADMIEVRNRIDPAIFEKFKRLGVRYDRVFHGHIDLPWQDVFQTHDKNEVARFCEANDITHAWLEDDVLKTSQVCPGVIRHPTRHEDFLFNQAHLFHPSAMGEQTLQYMLDAFGPELLPRNAFYGNGEAIESETLAALRGAYGDAAVDHEWQEGDVVLIDNVQVAHGRRSFTGDRLILTALLDPNTVPAAHAADTDEKVAYGYAS